MQFKKSASNFNQIFKYKIQNWILSTKATVQSRRTNSPDIQSQPKKKRALYDIKSVFFKLWIFI